MPSRNRFSFKTLRLRGNDGSQCPTTKGSWISASNACWHKDYSSKSVVLGFDEHVLVLQGFQQTCEPVTEVTHSVTGLGGVSSPAWSPKYTTKSLKRPRLPYQETETSYGLRKETLIANMRLLSSKTSCSLLNQLQSSEPTG